MKVAVISDVHIKQSGDDAEKLLLSFFRNEFVQGCDAIYLIGDIFDLMIGPHSQYFSRFQEYFLEIKKLIQKKIKIYYVQGNHDFHIEKLYRNFFTVNSDLDKSCFEMNSEFTYEDGGKKIYLSHGDDVEIDNFNYRLFKGFVTSTPLTLYANYLMPYFLITKVGEASSNASRKRNNKRYSMESDLAPVKIKFRKSAEIFFQKRPFDLIVCGHSHVKDHFKSDLGFEYINNGYAQHSKTYIAIVDGNASFKDIF